MKITSSIRDRGKIKKIKENLIKYQIENSEIRRQNKISQKAEMMEKYKAKTK